MSKINLSTLLAVCVLIVTLAGPAGAVTWYVDPNGSANFTTIQAAIDDPCTVDDDQIEVAPATYNEAINFHGKAVRLYSKDGPDVTIIDANGVDGAFHVVQCISGEDANTILEGFTITGGNASGYYPHDMGGGMGNDSSSPTVTNCTFSCNEAKIGGGMCNYNYSSPTVTNCTFSGNSAYYSGGGMDNRGYSDPNIANCTFTGNSAGDYGGGMFNNGGNPSVTNCTFTGNSAYNYGGGMFNIFSSPTVTNCTFTGNSAYNYGGGMCNNYSSPTVTNCTFTGNSAGDYGGGMYNDSSSPTVTNCILWNDMPDGIFNSDCTPIVTYSDVQGGYTGMGNIDADPCFVDADSNDFHLLPDSPCIDAGDNSAVTEPNDLAGNPRIVDGDLDSTATVDMGAFELPGVHNITQDTWYGTIQEAMDDPCTVNGDQIKVAAGMYNEAINFNGKAVRLYSSSGPDVTIIDANGIAGAYHVVQCVSGEDANTILEGFTITGGNANGSDANASGGGMYSYYSSPMVTNCIFTGNTANYGGGMHNSNSSPIVTSCSFLGNLAFDDAGGMYNGGNSHAIVTNCLFSGNSAPDKGGGIYNTVNSDALITNCTFSGNAAGYGGGICNWYDSDPNVTNCILWGNTATYGTQIAVANNSQLAINHSDLEGGIGGIWASGGGMVYDGGGNLQQDPLFVNAAGGDFRLVSSGSPCVDTGNNSVVTEANDLAGNPRVADGDNDGLDEVDMGAYEFNGGPVRNIRLNRSYLTIQAAIDDPCAVNGDQIEVGPGTYYEAINFIGKAVRLYGSGGPDVTTIDGTGHYHVVQCVSGEDANTILEGFTITGGNANGSYPDNRGGGMYNYSGSSPTVTNCTFTNNSSVGWGGGMYNDMGSHSTVTNCTFIGNTSDTGGGMCNEESSPTVTNCTFSGNYAEGGGGMCNEESSPTVTNCTFSGNYAEGGGGGMCNEESCPTVTNCILWGDTPEEIFDFSSTPTVTYSDVQGGTGQSWFGTGCIDADPLFADPCNPDPNLRNFRVAPGSPCIDAGDNNSVPEGIETDLDGHPRFVDGDCNDTVIVDMGAFEFDSVYLGDFDSDCDIDFIDFAIFASQWLLEKLSEDIAPGRGDGVVNFVDYAVFADGWQCNFNGLADFASQWLELSAYCADIAPAPAGNGIVDTYDLAILCDNWLAGTE